MKVYIVNYRGTIYGVFDSYDKAAAYVDHAFSVHNRDCIMSRDVM